MRSFEGGCATPAAPAAPYPLALAPDPDDIVRSPVPFVRFLTPCKIRPSESVEYAEYVRQEVNISLRCSHAGTRTTSTNLRIPHSLISECCQARLGHYTSPSSWRPKRGENPWSPHAAWRTSSKKKAKARAKGGKAAAPVLPAELTPLSSWSWSWDIISFEKTVLLSCVASLARHRCATTSLPVQPQLPFSVPLDN